MNKFELQRKRVHEEMNRKLNKIKQSGISQAKLVRKQAEAKLAKIDRLEKNGNTVSKKKNNNQVIPVFFASDANYLPYLSVSLHSLKDNCNKNHTYKIYILHTGIEAKEQEPILKFNDDKFMVSFVNVSEKLEDVKNGLQLRDYYTGATYYRIFIANMFPEFDKAIYLDSDTIILGDVSKLYNFDLKDNLVGAITDKVVASHPVFQAYCREVLGIEPIKYFNAGILLMNLKKFRDDDFYNEFRDLLLEYKFCVAQDQDYLNVICKDKVRYLPYSWNTMPIGGEEKVLPNLIHYNLTMKPWHYADIPYAKYFWKYAQSSSYSDIIRKAFGEHTLAKKQKDDQTEAGLIALAQQEIEREDNFIKMRNKNNEQVDVFEKLLFGQEEIFEFEDQDNKRVGVNG